MSESKDPGTARFEKPYFSLFTRLASVDLTNAVLIRCSCLRMKTIRHFQVT